jgi:hypothetical protein
MDESRPVSARPPPGSAGLASALSGPVDADEAEATKARRRYRSERMPAMGPDPAIEPLLAPGEVVLAVYRRTGFERRPASEGKAGRGRGDLYLTSARLVLLVPLELRVIEICLDQIQEAMVSANQLLLVLHDGAGISLEVDRPLLLRVELATARAARTQDHARASRGRATASVAPRAATAAQMSIPTVDTTT